MNCFDKHIALILEQYTNKIYDTQHLKHIQQHIFDWWVSVHSHDFSSDEFKNITKYFLSVKKQAYDMLIKFHQNELMIAKLTHYHYTDDQQHLLEQLRSEIRNMFTWLREFLKAMLLTRIGGDIYVPDEYNEQDEKYNYTQRIFSLDEFDRHCKQQIKRFENEDGWHESGGTIPWKSMYMAYTLLQDASSLSEKIQAISLALNACHDNGRIFDQWLGVYTEREFDQLSNINEREVDRQLNKLLGSSISFTV